MKTGKFIWRKTDSGKWYFNLSASNGKVIATSEMYNTKSAMMNGIKSVNSHAADAVIVEG